MIFAQSVITHTLACAYTGVMRPFSKTRAGVLFSVPMLILSLSLPNQAIAEDQRQGQGQGQDQNDGRSDSQQNNSFKNEQPNFSNNRELTLESGMEPVIIQPSRQDGGALVKPGSAALYTGTADTSSIVYRLGAPVMTGVQNIYEVWYGSWSSTSAAKPTAKAYQTFTNNFLSTMASPGSYWGINHAYYQATKAGVNSGFVGNPTLNPANQKVVAANTSKYGTTLSQSSIYKIVKDAFFPTTTLADANAIYLVLTSSEIKVSGFGTQFCGWHSYNSTSNAKYSFVGDPANTSGCLAQSVGPNLAGADSMLSVIAHELEETVTDPQLNAWYSANGNENGDKCAWTWGATTPQTNGAYSNMTINGTNYLIQQNFKLASAPTSTTSAQQTWSGTCAKS